MTTRMKHLRVVGYDENMETLMERDTPAYLRDDWKERRVDLMLDRERVGYAAPSEWPFAGMIASVVGALVAAGVAWWLV